MRRRLRIKRIKTLSEDTGLHCMVWFEQSASRISRTFTNAQQFVYELDPICYILCRRIRTPVPAFKRRRSSYISCHPCSPGSVTYRSSSQFVSVNKLDCYFPRPRHYAHTLLDVSRGAVSKESNDVTDWFKGKDDEQTWTRPFRRCRMGVMEVWYSVSSKWILTFEFGCRDLKYNGR